MCGICGILEFDGDLRDRARRVDAMSAALRHRGPDDRGVYTDPSVSLGFRRLSVIDLETGEQPIRLENDRAVIVLNGEIYNFRELRAEIGEASFRSKGDVEVVLRLYAKEGISALKRLNGMFSVAIWDRLERTLYCARDAFGIKPLYVHRDGRRLAFASELRSLLAGGFPRSPEIDRRELRHYLYQKYTSPRGSILEGVESLEPGTVLEIRQDGERRYRFWEPGDAPKTPLRPADAAAELEGRLSRAVKRQLVADVPVGVFLSGGVDSSTLAALAGRATASEVSTFSVGFSGEGAVSELSEARVVSGALGTRHHELHMSPEQVAGDLSAILEAQDSPSGDATCIPTWYLSRLARESVTVALSGEGADELFGGYPRQHYDVWIDRLGAGARLLPSLLRIVGRPVSDRLVRRLGMPPGLRRQLDWSTVFTRSRLLAIAKDPLPTEEDALALHDGLARRWSELARKDPLNARLAVDRELFLAGDLLPKVDRMSMAHSLEVRVPYLDHEVADWLIPLPGTLKADLRRNKKLLRRVTRKVLPPSVASRPKRGFDVPVSGWLRANLREALTDYLDEATVKRRGLFRPEAIGAMVREHLTGAADHGERLWLLTSLEGWQQTVLDRVREIPA